MRNRGREGEALTHRIASTLKRTGQGRTAAARSLRRPNTADAEGTEKLMRRNMPTGLRPLLDQLHALEFVPVLCRLRG